MFIEEGSKRTKVARLPGTAMFREVLSSEQTEERSHRWFIIKRLGSFKMCVHMCTSLLAACVRQGCFS